MLANKMDLMKPDVASQPGLPNDLYETVIPWHLKVSAMNEKTRDLVLGELVKHFALQPSQESSLISSARQFELTTEAYKQLDDCISEFKQGLGAEFISQRLKEALVSSQKILGEHYDDQILDRVFKEFCLGK